MISILGYTLLMLGLTSSTVSVMIADSYPRSRSKETISFIVLVIGLMVASLGGYLI